MKLSIDLSPAQTERLRVEAERLGLRPEDLARAAIADLLASAGEDFNAAAERVLKKNEELYQVSAPRPSLDNPTMVRDATEQVLRKGYAVRAGPGGVPLHFL